MRITCPQETHDGGRREDDRRVGRQGAGCAVAVMVRSNQNNNVNLPVRVPPLSVDYIPCQRRRGIAARETRGSCQLRARDNVQCTLCCESEQKEEQSKLMKEYEKKNKENDMSLSSKRKEDFGACKPSTRNFKYCAMLHSCACRVAAAPLLYANSIIQRLNFVTVTCLNGYLSAHVSRSSISHLRSRRFVYIYRPPPGGGDSAEPRSRSQRGQKGRSD